MKLNIVKANINTIPDASRAYLSILKEPFYFTYYKGVLYVNEDLADLEKIIPTIENLWECTSADPTEASSTAIDTAYDLIADLQGNEAASQISSTWHSAATEYSKQKSKEEARTWLETVYEHLTEEQYDAMENAGFKSRIVDNGMWMAMEAMYREGAWKYEHYLSVSRHAVGVYGFLLGMEYGKKSSTNEPGAMSDREKLIAEITEGLNDLDEKSLDMVRDYVLMPWLDGERNG